MVNQVINQKHNSANSWHPVVSSPGSTRSLIGPCVLSRLRYRLLQSALELVGVAGAWRLSVELRFFLNAFLGANHTRADLFALAPPVLVLLVLWMLIAFRFGFLNRTAAEQENRSHLSQAAFATSILAAIAGFIAQAMGAEISRSIVILFALLSFAAITSARSLTLGIATWLEERWPTSERIAVVGSSEREGRVSPIFRGLERGSAELVGVISFAGNSNTSASEGRELPLIGDTDQLAILINRHNIDRLILIDEDLSVNEGLHCERVARQMKVTVSHLVGSYREDLDYRLSLYGKMMMVDTCPRQFSLPQTIKRLLDVLVSASMILALAPLLLGLAILIKMTSKGPVLYSAPRVGRGGRYFSFLKFRSMYLDADESARIRAQNEQHGHAFKIRRDPRTTPLGRFMRRHSLDELPQLFNVLRGDMSLVGPRPLPSRDLDPDGQSAAFRSWSELRSSVPPGISGLWQVSGRSDLPFEAWVELDQRYVQDWSLALDLQILLRTPLVVLTGKGAY